MYKYANKDKVSFTPESFKRYKETEEGKKVFGTTSTGEWLLGGGGALAGGAIGYLLSKSLSNKATPAQRIIHSLLGAGVGGAGTIAAMHTLKDDKTGMTLAEQLRSAAIKPTDTLKAIIAEVAKEKQDKEDAALMNNAANAINKAKDSTVDAAKRVIKAIGANPEQASTVSTVAGGASIPIGAGYIGGKISERKATTDASGKYKAKADARTKADIDKLQNIAATENLQNYVPANSNGADISKLNEDINKIHHSKKGVIKKTREWVGNKISGKPNVTEHVYAVNPTTMQVEVAPNVKDTIARKNTAKTVRAAKRTGQAIGAGAGILAWLAALAANKWGSDYINNK